jgi:hypothetical protein
VPFGVAASAPVTFSTAAPRNKNRHCCWYGTSGAGKGYSLRVLLSRERFANGLRVYGAVGGPRVLSTQIVPLR